MLLDEDSSVLETERANIFAVIGALIRTPALDGRILAGTTREEVICLARRAGFEVSQGPLAIEELVSADEIFVTSSIRGLCAVNRLGEDRHLDGGPVSSVLAEALWKSWSRAVARPVADAGVGPDR